MKKAISVVLAALASVAALDMSVAQERRARGDDIALLDDVSPFDRNRECLPRRVGLITEPEIIRLLRVHPTGGLGLTNSVEDMLERDPVDAPIVVKVAKNANPEQKAAIALAFWRAWRFERRCDADGADAIRAALAGDSVMADMFASIDAQTVAGASGFGGGGPFYPGGAGGFPSGGGTGGGGPISPN